ncbi:MAG: hydrogenase maturation protease [Elusimicrobiota bacterium]
MSSVFLGLGNTIRADDGAGIRVAREIKGLKEDAVVFEACIGGLDILDYIEGFKKAVIIDSIKTGSMQPGELLRLKPEDFTRALHLSSPHTMNFPTAIEFGKRMGFDIPGEIVFYAIEVLDNLTYSEKVSPCLESAFLHAAKVIVREQFDA